MEEPVTWTLCSIQLIEEAIRLTAEFWGSGREDLFRAGVGSWMVFVKRSVL